MEVAKRLYQDERGLKTGDIITWREIEGLLGTTNLSCPKGGRYQLGPIGVDPSCSYTGTMVFPRGFQGLPFPFTYRHSLNYYTNGVE